MTVFETTTTQSGLVKISGAALKAWLKIFRNVHFLTLVAARWSYRLLL